jgi:hypothetical protein
MMQRLRFEKDLIGSVGKLAKGTERRNEFSRPVLESRTVERLLAVLDRNDVVRALDRMKRPQGDTTGRLTYPTIISAEFFHLEPAVDRLRHYNVLGTAMLSADGAGL